MPVPPKKISADKISDVGVIWSNLNSINPIEGVLEDLTDFFGSGIQKGIIYLLSSGVTERQQEGRGERVAAASPEEMMKMLGRTLAAYWLYKDAREVRSILESIVRDFDIYLQSEGVRQAIAFIVTQKDALGSIRGFCRRCSCNICYGTWPRKGIQANKAEVKVSTDRNSLNTLMSHSKNTDLTNTDGETSTVPQKMLRIADKDSGMRHTMKGSSLISRLRQAQQNGDLEKAREIMVELEKLREKAREDYKKNPVLVTT